MISHYAETSTTTAAPEYLGLEDFEEVGVPVAERCFGAKDMIFAPGDPDRQLYFLLEGTVRLYKIYGEYKEATVTLLKDGGVFGELSLDEGSWQNVFAVAVTDARVAVVRKSILAEVIKRHPEFAVKLLFSFSERLLDREVSARLARLLLNLSDRFGDTNGSGTVLNVRLTHQDLANMIVSTREAVSKVMSEFQREGLIEIRNRRISVAPQLAEMS